MEKKEAHVLLISCHSLIMEELIRDYEEKMVSKYALEYDGSSSCGQSYSFFDVLVHDRHPDIALAYKALAYKANVRNRHGFNNVYLSAAHQNADKWQLWKAAIRVKLTSLIEKQRVFRL